MLVACSGGNQNDLQKPDTYTVTFVQSGQEDVVKTVNAGDTLTDVPSVVPVTGYTVVWESKDLTNINKNITVNAVKTANTYTVTYDANGGSVDENTQKVAFDAAYALKTPTYPDASKVFVCWKNGAQSLTPNGVWKIADNVTLTAEWIEASANTCTVTFVQQGQSNKTYNVQKGGTLSAYDAPVSKTGYTVVWDPDDLEKLTDKSESVTVNAVETPNNYKVFYDLGERKNDTQNIAITGGDASLKTDSATGKKYCPVTFDAEYNLAKPACNGYKFVGWIIESTQTAFTNGTYTTASDITIVAQWEIDETHDRWWTEEY